MDQLQRSILDGSSIQRNSNLEFPLKRAIFDRRIRFFKFNLFFKKVFLLNSGTGSLTSGLMYHTSMIEETDCTLSIISDTRQ
jgi:hypothetical protein